MKTNNKIIIAAAAGLAVAGLVGYLLATEKGRKTTRAWKSKGKEFASSVEGIIDSAVERLNTIKADCASEKVNSKMAQEEV